MKKLAMDIIEKNERGILAKAELEKMMGCKLDEMTDDELCEFIYGMQIAIIRKFAQTFGVEIEEEIEATKNEILNGFAEQIKTEI